jgi:hypothetical protein
MKVFLSRLNGKMLVIIPLQILFFRLTSSVRFNSSSFTAFKAVFVITSLSALVSIAQGEENKESSWHQIEYILFQHLRSDTHVLRYENTAYPQQSHHQFNYLVSHPYPASPFQYTRLKPEEMQLSEALKRLSSSRDTKVLDYGAWQQALITDGKTLPLKISQQISDNTVLFGELLVRKSRFTHAEFSVYLADPVQFSYADTKDWFLTPQRPGSLLDLILPLPAQSQLLPLQGSQTLYFKLFHLSESRRIKQGEIHYLDHPVIGAIVTINAIEPPPETIIFDPSM